MNELLGNSPSVQGGAGQSAAPNALASPPGPGQFISQVVQGATDPQTGELNHVKVFVGLAANPATQRMAGRYLQDAQAGGALNVAPALEELKREYEKTKLISQTTAPLLELGANVTQKELINAVASPEFARAVPDPRLRAQLLVSAPRGGRALAEWISAQAQGAQAALDAMQATMGEIQESLAPRPDVRSAELGELLRAPGWLGKAAQRYLAEHPQVLQGNKEAKIRVLREQLSALQKQEQAARGAYDESELAAPFESWWENQLTSRGIV